MRQVVPVESFCSILYAVLQLGAAAGAALGWATAGPAAVVAPTASAATERPTAVRLRARLILFTRMTKRLLAKACERRRWVGKVNGGGSAAGSASVAAQPSLPTLRALRSITS